MLPKSPASEAIRTLNLAFPNIGPSYSINPNATKIIDFCPEALGELMEVQKPLYEQMIKTYEIDKVLNEKIIQAILLEEAMDILPRQQIRSCSLST